MSRSKADQERLDVIHNMPCICCYLAGLKILQPSRTEAHHIVDGGYREHSGGDQSTLPLCGWHHRADMPDWRDRKETMLARFGPSLEYQGKKNGFMERWGTERELLDKVNELIKKGLL